MKDEFSFCNQLNIAYIIKILVLLKCLMMTEVIHKQSLITLFHMPSSSYTCQNPQLDAHLWDNTH